ncbi:tRNA (N6-threonylcarbamoyladenosine(37)-N6)-methyltransferase TrmO [Desulfohalobiaceae bacterium Ax17]|uniref:tRNA (N6-threonylcarbamoyladenosine(37)-N6)-methyltransferase TrmO n=1 Tax=Desulfovulcanus ferrireducens TaxID=2831190 RepID=UPI00207BCBA9|nr:tRNA (N6-threonylcarbamoyladenosine(37)-N6)-methyltransferase TrmO [Desulfovulcanus ferrireducens]MBT8762593.1 tRNA (N6-threonylcarbamoyladenosine(37)-N6)-methyltransferase TrmO [Desulfovulcanus ferrireducens]
MNHELRTIGLVRSPVKDPGQCPKQGDAKCPKVWIEIFPQYAEALDCLSPDQEIIVLTWLHMARRDVLRCHPRDNPNIPLHGVFATRSPDRPNPIGLHQVRIIDTDGNRLLVHPLEVVDQTPIIDIKPVLQPKKDDAGIGVYFPMHLVQDLIRGARTAWDKGLLNGFNGNLSLRENNRMLITNSGAAKGHLRVSDLSVLDVESGRLLNKGFPSSETPMHLEIYRQQKNAQAIVHTHPPHLLALSLLKHDMLDLPLFEAEMFKAQMATVPALKPGSKDLALAVGQKAKAKKCIFLQRHGLICWGERIEEALALSEELEALARIEIYSRR